MNHKSITRTIRKENKSDHMERRRERHKGVNDMSIKRENNNDRGNMRQCEAMRNETLRKTMKI